MTDTVGVDVTASLEFGLLGDRGLDRASMLASA